MFTGYERDVESVLDYAQARYFKPRHGRFTSVDPLTASANIKDPQTFNRYSYVLNSPYKYTDPLGLRPCSGASWDSWCDNSGDLGGGAILAEALDRYEQNLQNTRDAGRINGAVANNDNDTAEAVCAGNARVTCERARPNAQTGDGDDNAPQVVLDSIDLVDTDDPSTTDVLVKGDVGALGGPTVEADGLKPRFTQGAKVFLRLKFFVAGGAGRGRFATKEDQDASEKFSISTPKTSKWVLGGPTIDAGEKTATIYVPMSIQDGTTERISIKATVSWVDRVETGIRGRIETNVTKDKTYSFSARVKFTFHN